METRYIKSKGKKDKVRLMLRLKITHLS